MQDTPLASLNDDRAPSLRRITGITPNSDITNQTTGFSLRAAVAVLPSEQFEQVLYALNDITPQEARGMAVVTLCSNFLEATKESTKAESLSSIPATQIVLVNQFSHATMKALALSL